jgi:plasmid stabilization system protein ParE
MPRAELDFHPEALLEAQEAYLWYSERSESAGQEFMKELDHAIDQISESSGTWPTYLFGTCRYLLRRFPFLVVYRLQRERIQVVAIAHGKRQPGYWRHR